MNNLKLVNLIILTVIGMLAGCKKDDATSTQANYYVKYTVVSNSAPYIGVKLKTNINNESNLIVERLIGTGNWEYIVGPVNKDFKASLSVVKDGWTGQVENHLKINLSIAVSKDNAPFVTKVFDDSDLPRAYASLDYSIL
jgi:curli biogenesis system outer membrane secretion channel CsgG